MNLFTIIIFLFIFLLLMLLLVRHRIRLFTLKNENITSHTVELMFFFNMLTFRFSLTASGKHVQAKVFSLSLFKKRLKDSAKKEKKTKPKVSRAKKEHKLKKLFNLKNIPAEDIRTHGITILKSIKISLEKCKIIYGFTNPMYSGLIFGFFSMLAGIRQEFEKEIKLIPVFDQEILQWHLSLLIYYSLAPLMWRGFYIWRAVRKAAR